MTVADDAVAGYCAELDALDREVWALRARGQLVGAAQDASAAREALQPVVVVAIKLAVGTVPGADPEGDAEWAAMTALARREVLAVQRAGRDCGLAAASLRLLDRVDQLTCVRTDAAWQQRARERVGELVDASRRGYERGRRLREQRADRQPASREPPDGWHLRHPNDYWLRYALAADLDPDCRHLLEELQARVHPFYQRLRDLDWSSWESAAPIVCTVEIRTSHAGALKTPVQAVATTAVRGDVKADQRLALAMVEDPEQPFNGQLLAVMDGDRWRICARAADDETLVALDGSRRLSP